MSEHELWNELGNLYFLSGSLDQAARAYSKAIQLESSFGKPYCNLAQVYAKQAKYQDAIPLYKKSLELLTDDSEKAISWNRLGDVYRHLKEYKDAIYAYEHADQLSSNIDEVEEQPSQMLYISSESVAQPYEMVEGGKTPQSAEIDNQKRAEPEIHTTLEQTSQKETGFPVSFVHRSPKTLEALENTEIATLVATLTEEESSTPSIETDPKPEDDLPVFVERESTEDFMFAPEAATMDLEEESTEVEEMPVEELFPEHFETALTDSSLPAGDTESLSGKTMPIATETNGHPEEEAQELSLEYAKPFDQALVENEAQENAPLNPANEEIASNPSLQIVSDNAQEVGKEIEAEEEKLTKQIQLNPRNAATWEALGTLYKTAGRYDDAILAYQQALSIAPQNVSNYHNLGLVFSAQGKNKEAFAAYQKVLELDPDHSLTHASLGGYYKKLGLVELAQKHIGKAMKNIYESENEYNRACLDAICGNKDQAVELLRIALENKQTYVDWVLHDPDLDSLHGDERFKQLISEFSK